MKKNLKDILNIISKINYKNSKFIITEGEGGFMLRVKELNPTYGNIYPLIHELDWYISSWSTDTEVVRTAYKAVMDIEMQTVQTFTNDCIVRYSRLLKQLCCYEHDHSNEEICRKICKAFQYKNWSLRAQERDSGFLFQIVFLEKDNVDPTRIEMQYCRKWFIDNECVSRTNSPAIKRLIREAINAAETHEINENFTYSGVTIYNPHMNLDGMVDFIKKTPFDTRPAPITIK